MMPIDLVQICLQLKNFLLVASSTYHTFRKGTSWRTKQFKFMILKTA